MIPIDPLTALAGIQSAISMVKKAAGVAQDLSSLAPMLGKLFDAKSTATKAMLQAKQSGKGSKAMKDWVEAIIASACVACFVIFCSYIIVWAYP